MITQIFFKIFLSKILDLSKIPISLCSSNNTDDNIRMPSSPFLIEPFWKVKVEVAVPHGFAKNATYEAPI